MARGQKICPSCLTATGPRAYKCANPNCNHIFAFKPTSKEKKNTKIIDKVNWRELLPGDKIKVRGGSYYVSHGEFIPMGAKGKFTVCKVEHNGILGYSGEGGYGFIYMGPDKQSKETGVWHTKHKIIKMVPRQLGNK